MQEPGPLFRMQLEMERGRQGGRDGLSFKMERERERGERESRHGKVIQITVPRRQASK